MRHDLWLERDEVSMTLVESVAFEGIRMTDPAGDRRSLSAHGFARLLGSLHPDPDQAAPEYERLRRALVKFFDWRGPGRMSAPMKS